jgi:DNA-binding CsgD family transcriptional regulator
VAALLALGRTGQARTLVEQFAAAERRRRAPAPGAALLACRALLAEAGGLDGQGAPERPGGMDGPNRQNGPGRLDGTNGLGGPGGPESRDAAGAWQAAAGAWATVPRPYEALRARERAAACLRAAGNRVAAAREAEAVIAGYGALGAAFDEQRARKSLTGGGRGYGDQLSPRELEVVRLVAQGMTNRQIAQALSRSPKTVAAQLNSAMRKRGVTSRTALAVSMTQPPPAPGDSPAPGRG